MMRRACPTDAGALYEVMISSRVFPEALKNISGEEAIKKIKESFKEKQFYIAIQGKNIVGYTSFAPMGLYPDLELLSRTVNKREYCMSSGLVVKPSFRNKGIAMQLKLYAFKEASKKYKRMYSTLSANNKASVRLQRSLGLKKAGEYNRKGRKMLIFFKRL